MDITTLAIALSKISQLRKEVKKEGFKVQVEQDRSILNNSGIEKIIYLLPKNTAAAEDGYDEFIYANNAWESIGGGGAATNEIYIGDTEPSDSGVVLWIDTSSGGEPIPETTDPVTNLAGTATANSVTIGWQPSSNAASYKIYQGDVLIDSVTGTSYTINDLMADTSYTFGVVASGVGGDSPKVTLTIQTQQGGDLPAEYQEVEYVQPVGIANQINTGIENSVIAKIEMGLYNNFSKFMKITGAATNSSWAQSDTPYIRTESALVENSPLVGVGYTNCSISPVSSEYVGQTKYVDFIFTVSSSETNYFTFGNDLSSVNNTEEAKYYYVKLYNSSNVMIANYVPCYRKSDNKVGMYDLINEEFIIPVYGDFQKGGDV